ALPCPYGCPLRCCHMTDGVCLRNKQGC
uniref:Augerpeptide hhe6.2 n=1 Tax=Hastula hectica TaxID=745793 RepID=TE62_HASHE|nr:RecName: Full=Augerpeptide hhe6.2 [Hastula hectica]